ncbi:hypothetical protein [Micromonospora sp. NPDC050200]|uniref:hypothetical protein n=1 Tax=Micromonospora sp. NPDC050200 TaxID=3155664 RepID=UPI0033FCA631
MSHVRSRPHLGRRAVATAAALLLAVVAGASSPAHAADLAFTNGSFENDLAGWKQFGGDANTTATVATSPAPVSSGQRSARITDSSGVSSIGLESGSMTAKAGTRYTAFARFYAESGTPSLYLRFYDAANTLVGNFYTVSSGAPGTWSNVRISGSAPTGTTRMTVLPYSAKDNVGSFYVDEVAVSAQLTDLGEQIDSAQVNGSTFGLGANQDKVYGVFTSSNDVVANPAQFATIDVDTNAVVTGSATKLPGASVGWAATTATDGSVYFGTTQNGHLFRHVPGITGVIDLGQAVAGDTVVWDLTPGLNGRVYGGTYDSGGYFTYQPGYNVVTIGAPMLPGKLYVRSLAFDPATETTYLGMGTSAALVAYNRITTKKQEIGLPARYATAPETMVGGLTWTGGRLFMVMASGALSVLRIVEGSNGTLTAVEEAYLDKSALAVSPERNGKVYVMSRGQLQEYDIAAKTFTPLGITTPITTSSFGWVDLADQAAWPGTTLVMVGHGSDGDTYLFKYDTAGRRGETKVVTGTPRLAQDISAIGAGSDGKIYTGGFLVGGTGAYQPVRGDGNDTVPDEPVRWGLTQAEVITTQGGKTYFATYPSAQVYEYDPTLPWEKGVNPSRLFYLSGYGQDRPYALVVGGGKLFVGTVPKYGAFNGALSVYDLTTRGEPTVYQNFIQDQGVVALAYHNGKLYGGSTIRGGLGVENIPRATEARFFVYDPATNTKTEYPMPAGVTALTALAVVDGKIWGLAEGQLFIFDPATAKFTTPPTNKFLEIDYKYGIWEDAKLTTVPQDTANVYGVIGHTLFKINKTTLEVTRLVTGDTQHPVDHLAVDQYGNLYYNSDHKLYRYAP